jgi:hypothetical protein
MTHKDKEKQLVGKIRQALDESTQNMDARILSRLNQARQKAQTQTAPSWFERLQSNRFPLAGGMAAAAVMLFFLFYFTKPSEIRTYSGIEDVEILATGDSPEFFSELDFYTWLAEEMENAG